MQGITVGFSAFSGSLKLKWKRGEDEKCTKAENRGHAAACGRHHLKTREQHATT